MSTTDAPTAQLPPDPPPPTPRRERLTRSAQDRMLAGVSGGLARHFDVDPTIVRVAFALLALLGGAGILLYAVLALVVPGEPGPAGGPSDAALSTGAVVVLVLLGLVTLPFVGGGLLFFAPGLAVLALLAALGVLLVRALRGDQATAGRIVLALVGVAAAAALGVGAAAGVAFGGGTLVAILAVAAGVALVVLGLLGGARWLVLPALAIAVPAVLVAGSGLNLRGGVGNREVHATVSDELAPAYRLGVGRLALDLRDVRFRGVTDLRVTAGMGSVEVVVPRDVCVQTTATTSMGALEVFGRDTSGVDVGTDDRPAPKAGAPVLRISGDVTVGRLWVSHRSADRGWERVADRQGACASR